MQGSSVVIDHICQIWENRIFKKNWKIYILRVLEFRENSKTDISSDQKNTIHDNITMHFIGGRGRVGFVKELKVVNSNKE